MTGLCYPAVSENGIELISLKKVKTRKQAFYMLPGKKTSMVKIEPLPPVRGKNLDSIIKIQIKNLYPGRLDEISLSYIIFEKGKNRTAVLYFIKNFASGECSNIKRCRGIILPLQLIKRRDLKNTDVFIAEYPDMIEIWKLKEGVPEGYSRTEIFSPYEIDNSRKYLILTRTDRFFSLKGRENIIIKNFEELSTFPLHWKKYFSSSVKRKYYLGTYFLIITAFAISVMTLILETERKRISDTDLRLAEKYLEKVKTMEKKEYGIINTINSLYEKLNVYSGIIETSPYSVLTRLKNAAGTRTKIISFIWKDSGRIISVSCSSENVLESIASVRDEFRNVRITGISVNNDGTGKYRIYMEEER